ncbi:MAG TPA: hypothetical protein VFP29_11145, partial [Methyloceanibacter sp.]|nr:hypothetical protein [Methyloceanibacter sp.]
AARVEKTSVLIIDEISMLPARSLTLVDEVCRHIRGSTAPFGGLQVVLVGDFFQLPPVWRREAESGVLPLGDDAYGSGFAHASPAWRDLSPTVCYLSEQHRQSDAAFLDVLAAIRTNACGRSIASAWPRERSRRIAFLPAARFSSLTTPRSMRSTSARSPSFQARHTSSP